MNRLEEKVINLVIVGVTNQCGYFKDRALCACDEVFGKKRGMRNKEDTLW